MGKFIVINHKVLSEDQFLNDKFNGDYSVYEVIRLIDGIAIFVEEHYYRLLSSLTLSGIKFNMELPDFIQYIHKLMNVNQQFEGNVKFVITKEEEVNWAFSFIPHSYPNEDDYRKGVLTGLFFAERNNPKAKVIQRSVREQADKLIKEGKLYEVLLVDSKGNITEGSRSNVFFVKGNQFYTASASQVLSGVTRKKVIECLQELDYKIIEEAVLSKEIDGFDAAFLTGTSPKVLPINSIDGISFEAANPYIEKLMNQYDKKIEQYIMERKA